MVILVRGIKLWLIKRDKALLGTAETAIRSTEA